PTRRLSFSLLMRRRPTTSTLFPYTTLFRSPKTLASLERAQTSRPKRSNEGSPNLLLLLRMLSLRKSLLIFRFFVRRERFLTKNRSEEHTSELQSRGHLVCRLLLEKKKKTIL